jgi:Protein of unknown function (DUF2914)
MKISIHLFKTYLPAIAFFGGFLWDALTIGKQVGFVDLWMLFGYLLAAAAILWWLGHRHANTEPADWAELPPSQRPLKARMPFLLLQFLFGSLFSALFILYFKSANHLLAWLLTLCLAGLLVANEYLDDEYHRFTLTWALLGLCAMLLLNFLVPFIVGSIAWFWFYFSTALGAWSTHILRKKTPQCPGRAWPVWCIAALLAVAYPLDIIPPVPLVKRDIQVGLDFKKAEGEYQITLEKVPWWDFFHSVDDVIHVPAGERLYCVSSVFAPRGLNTRLYHHWLFYDVKQGWITRSRVGFGLSGGRNHGFRGYTYKSNLQAGTWKVNIETESGRTLAIHDFEVVIGSGEPEHRMTYVF